MRSWCDLDAILMRCYIMKNIILKVYQKLKSHKNTCFRRKISRSLRKKHRFEWKTSFRRCIKSYKVRKIQVFEAKFHALFEKSIVLDEKYHFEGVSKAKKSEKYMFSTQNIPVSSKKTYFGFEKHSKGLSEAISAQKCYHFHYFSLFIIIFSKNSWVQGFWKPYSECDASWTSGSGTFAFTARRPHYIHAHSALEHQLNSSWCSVWTTTTLKIL